MIFQIQGLCPACLVAPGSPNVRSRVSEGDPRKKWPKIFMGSSGEISPRNQWSCGPLFSTIVVSTLLGPLLVGVLTTLITGFLNV